MNIAEKNIQALQQNTFGSSIINFIVKQSNNEAMPFEVNSRHEKNNDWKRLKNRFNFNKHTNFIIIGIGNGSLIEKVYENMSQLSTLTIIEKYNSVLMKTLGTKDMADFLHDNRVCILAGENEKIINPLLKLRLMDENFIFNIPNMNIVTYPYLKSYDENFVNEILYYISSQITFNIHSFGNDINDVLEGFDHIVDNWDNMTDGLGINSFKNAYEGIPAIIVGAGPSLDKNIELLKKAYGKALILTVDATAKRVIDLAITPDTISSMERTDGVYDTFYQHLDIPKKSAFLGPPVVTKKIIDSFEKKILTGRKGELITKQTLNILNYDAIEIGTSCSHIPFGFAKYVGADPIVFIGQDLAFAEDGRTHFNGVAKRASEGALEMDQKWVLGNNGQKLITNEAYYRFLLWFENEISNTSDITFINATEGGARIKGTKVMRLEEVISEYCVKEIMHLGEMYNINKIQHDICTGEVIKNSNKYFEDLIQSASIVQDCIKKQNQELKKLEIDKKNLNELYNVINNLYEELSKNNTLRFIVQPYFVSFYRNVHQYPVQLKNEEWNKLIFETKNYCKKLFDIMEVLKKKFKNYKDKIEGDEN